MLLHRTLSSIPLSENLMAKIETLSSPMLKWKTNRLYFAMTVSVNSVATLGRRLCRNHVCVISCMAPSPHSMQSDKLRTLCVDLKKNRWKSFTIKRMVRNSCAACSSHLLKTKPTKSSCSFLTSKTSPMLQSAVMRTPTSEIACQIDTGHSDYDCHRYVETLAKCQHPKGVDTTWKMPFQRRRNRSRCRHCWHSRLRRPWTEMPQMTTAGSGVR